MLQKRSVKCDVLFHPLALDAIAVDGGVVNEAIHGARGRIVDGNVDAARRDPGKSETQRHASLRGFDKWKADGPSGGAAGSPPCRIFRGGVRDLLEEPILAVVALADDISHIVGE